MTDQKIETITIDTGPVRDRVYLGDGLYAARDDMHIILYTERENGMHWVGLEPGVFERLLDYKKSVMP